MGRPETRADGSDGAWSSSAAKFGATRPPRPVASHLSRCEPAKERKDTNIVSSQVDERRGHSLLEAAVGRWEPCYRQTIWASFDVWYHVWVNLCLQQGSSTRSYEVHNPAGVFCPGRPGRRTPSGQNLQHTWSTFRSTRPEHCFQCLSQKQELIRSDNLKPVSNRSWIAALGSASYEGKTSQYFLFIYLPAQPSILVWASLFFRCVCKCVQSVCIQSRSEQCRRGWYLFVTSSHHACPLETGGYDPKINAFIVLCKRLLQVG